MERRNPIRLFVLACACLAGTPATAQEQSPAWLGVYAEHHGGDVLYRYALGNRGRQALRAFRLGCDCPAADAEAGELPALPAGAWPEHEDARGVWYALAPEGVRAPPGWRARLRWPAGASGYWIEWYAADPRAGVPPGSSLAGFGLRVPGGHRAFLEAHFSADRAGGQRPQLLDLEPPTLALAVHGGAARAGMSVRIVAEVSDDRDPAPRVTLEAVAPAPPGPGGPDAWIVTYSATDASGNRATARTRVPRPAGPTGEVDGTPPAPSLLRLAVMP
jgi:hypothetical protein